MPFDIYGDEITYEGIPFATINGGAWPTLRAEAESELIHGPEGWVTEADAESRYNDGFDNGRSDAIDADAPLWARMIELLQDAIFTIEGHEDPDDDAWLAQAAAALKLAKAERG